MSELDDKDGLELETPLILSVAERVGRRGFMRKLAMGAMGLAAAMVGAPQKAEALVHVACCWLCNNSSGTCSGACCWSWGCCNANDQDRFYNCIECYSSQAACTGGCPAVCSRAQRTQFIC